MSSRDDAPLSVTAPPADYRALFEAVPTPLLVIAPPDWTIVDANDARLAVTGTTRDGQVGRRLFDLFPDDPADPDADGVRNLSASLERVLATGATETMPVQRYAVRDADGRFVERWWAPVNTPVLGPDGRVALVVHHVEDVTEVVRLRGDAAGRDELARAQQVVIDRLRASEARLRGSEEFSRRILESSADCIKVLRLDGRLERMSEGGRRALGVVDLQAHLGSVWADGFEPEWRATAHAAVAEAGCGRTSRFEGALVTVDGRLRWWDSVLTPISGADGRPERVLAISRDITDLRVAQDRVRESEDRFRNMADRAPVMMWVTDPSGWCTHLNARWYEFTGQAPNTGEGYGWLDAVHPDDRPLAEQAFVSANAERRDYRVDFRLRRADGAYRWTIDAAAARFGADGEYLGYIGSVIDIDERREAEKRLAEKEERLRLALHAGRLAEVTFDIPGGAVNHSPAFAELFGHPPDKQMTLAELRAQYHPDDHDRTIAERAAILASDQGYYEIEHRIVRPDGLFGWVYGRGQVDRDDGGAVRTVTAVYLDDTERKVAQEALRRLNETLEAQVAERTAALSESRRRFQGIFDSALQFMALLTPDGIVVEVNRTALAWSRIEPSDIVGRPFWRAAPMRGNPALQAAVEDGVRRAAAGETVRQEHEMRGAGDVRATIDFSLKPVLGDRGEAVWLVAEGRDITALKQAEDALRQSQKIESLGQLTGGVAHDFNNLLTVIRSSADLLRRHELSDEKRRRYVDAISDTADRAARLTAQLLAFSRRSALKAEVFDAAARVDGITDMIRTVLGSRVELAIDPGCPDCFVEADAAQFETALVNIVVNARDAMDGEGRLAIAVAPVDAVPPTRGHAGVRGAFVAVSVSDTGAGIAPEHLDRIFEPFYTTKDIGKGTGLGLSQVFGFAKQSGGEVDVASRVGAGTTFTLYLPRADAARAAAPSDRVVERADGRGRVLVVEDNVQVGEFAAQLLDDLGYRTALAPNAAEALERLEADAAGFDIVFSDVVMPGMGGVELARHLRERWPDLPVVLTSGYSHVLAEDARHGFPLLHKPYSVEDLSRILRRAAAGGG